MRRAVEFVSWGGCAILLLIVAGSLLIDDRCVAGVNGRTEIEKNGGIPIVVKAAKNFRNHPGVVAMAVGALGHLAVEGTKTTDRYAVVRHVS